MSNIKNRKEGGFTIIEVLIVLAIAGLIMLIVFLAVPALQRNSRNTQRKDDISRISGAIQEFMNNNSGALPGSGDASTIYSNAGNLAYYKTADNFSVTTSTPGTPTVDTVIAVVGSSCNTNGTALATGTSRQVAILYGIESSSGSAVTQCSSL